MREPASALLEVRNLHVRYDGPSGIVSAVDGVSFSLTRGETYALVGESGCGKSATALAVPRLVEPGWIASGTVRFDGVDLVGLTERELRRYRGKRIGFVFQDAGASLNPVLRVGRQVDEAIRAHAKMGKAEAAAEVERLLGSVRLPDPARQARAYPHELSGGMQQRAMLAIALAGRPELLIADEPTSALDVTIQAQLLALLRELKRELGLTLLLVTHDLGVVAENADRVGVMYAGRLVEEGPVEAIFDRPLHPYTRGLLRSAPGYRGHAEPGRSKEPLATLPGTVPDPTAWPVGCRFEPRCAEAFAPCAKVDPGETSPEPRRRVACHLHGDPTR